MTIACLVLWLIVFIADTISLCMGNDPNWILIYCPLITVICLYIEKAADEYIIKKNKGSR